MHRFKLYARLKPLAFLVGVATSATAGGQAVADAATFGREQFDGNGANNFFPC